MIFKLDDRSEVMEAVANEALFKAQPGDGTQHTHLVGGAGPTAAEHQPGDRGLVHGHRM
jgi:hypothetical protein